MTLLGLMLPLTVYFIVNLLGAAGERRQERVRLRLVRERIAVALDTEDAPESDEMAEDALNAVRDFPASSAIRRAVVAVGRARTLATPDLQAATNAVVTASESRLSIIRNIPNLLMLAGLLGTVLGLAGSIGSLVDPIRNAAQATEPGELARALGNTMEVMQGAFGASLWGILLSLITGIVYALAAKQHEAFQDELAAFVHAELVPAVFPRAITSQMERMARYLRDAGSTFQDIHTRLQEVAGQLENVLGRAGETLGQSLEQLSGTSAQIEKVFGSMDQSVQQLTQGLNQGVSDLVQAQEGAAASLRSTSREMEHNLTKQAKAITDLQESVGSNTLTLMERVEGVSDALGRAGGKFEQAGETIRIEQSNYAARLDRNFEILTRTLASGGSVGRTESASPPVASD
ncbi:MotA/TolQ/ExbB proton channel family protein [Deinococcus sp. QL22]|uniref:MotA/TolQ/ExbB proton channel family protein n=1 Tax=Deinococcus sp. QL22 TaxID=2939437 RepID=UPI0020173DAC|nr:MotA/TolQ/ExbB proton channel family protein [Deinococcus sp. QL22]UQN08778.1 MotA/TolQ/ExbB proton channel family protein [Deinococcus sp. QL22]